MKKILFLLFLIILVVFSYFHAEKQNKVYREITKLDNPKSIKYTAIPFVFFPYYYFKLSGDIKEAFSYHCINIIILNNGNKIYNVSGYGGFCPSEYILDNNSTLTEGDFF